MAKMMESQAAPSDGRIAPILPDRYYTPARVAFLLRHWAELDALAETPASARGLLEDGPTRESFRLGVRAVQHNANPNTWANVRADIEWAWNLLAHESMGWRLVGARLRGQTFNQMATTCEIRKQTMFEIYNAALLAMSTTLGWAEGKSDVEASEGMEH